jgi:hypothetical protein
MPNNGSCRGTIFVSNCPLELPNCHRGAKLSPVEAAVVIAIERVEARMGRVLPMIALVALLFLLGGADPTTAMPGTGMPILPP